MKQALCGLHNARRSPPTVVFGTWWNDPCGKGVQSFDWSPFKWHLLLGASVIPPLRVCHGSGQIWIMHWGDIWLRGWLKVALPLMTANKLSPWHFQGRWEEERRERGGAMTHRDGGSQMWSFSPKYSLNLFGCWTRWDVTRRLHLCFILWQTPQLLCNSDCLLLNWIVLKHMSLLHWRTPPCQSAVHVGEQQLLFKKTQLQHDAIKCLNICHMPHHI